MEKTCNHCGDTEGNDTFAMAMLKSYHKQATRWYITALVILSMWLATIFGFVWYLNQYDFSSETITVEQDSTEYERIFDRCVFSDVELQIIQAKRKSRSNVQIAQDLNISEATLTRYIRKISKKIIREL